MAKGEKLKGILKPTKKKVILVVVALIAIIGGVSFVNAKKAASAAAATPVYNTATVEKQDLKKEVSVNGTIASADKKTVQADLSDVEITQVNVKIGDKVKAGDVICLLDSSSIDTKLENTKSTSKITSEKASQAVTDAQTSYNNAITDKNTNSTRNAQAVTDTYNGYQTAIAERDGANIAYQQTQQNTVNAKSNYDTLLNTAGSNPTDVSNAAAAYEQAQIDEQNASATLTEAQQKVVTTEAAYKDAVQTQQDKASTDDRTVATQDSALDSAKLDAQANNSGETAQTIAELEKQKAECTVTAPIDGTITALSAEVGDIYKGTEIATIQNEGNLQVNATVDQYTVSDITEGMDVIIKTDTTGDLEMSGTLAFVSPVPKSETDSNGKTTVSTDYEIHATFTEQNERLRLGMNAKTTILIAEAKDVLALPGSCIQNEGDRSYVTVLVDEATGETKDIDVTVGLQTDYNVEVQGEGLKEGMQIIIPDDAATDTESADAIYG